MQSDSDFTVGEVQVAANHAARVDLENDGTFRIDTAESCGGPWTVAAVGVAGDSDRGGRHYVQATPATTTGQTLTDMLRLCTVFGERAYRGSLRLVDIGGDKFTLNEVLIEDYLLGVVPRESPAFWGTITAGEGGDEALKAQAVAGALVRRGARPCPCGARPVLRRMRHKFLPGVRGRVVEWVAP